MAKPSVVWCFLGLCSIAACGGSESGADDSSDAGAGQAVAGAVGSSSGAAGQASAAGAPSSIAGSSAAGAAAGLGGAGTAGSAGSIAQAGSAQGGSVAQGGSAQGGSVAQGGSAQGSGGKGGAGNSSAGAPAGGSGGSPTSPPPYGPSASCKAWPAATGSTQKLSKTQAVSGNYDGKLQRFVSNGLGDGTQGEGQEPLFELADGATLSNVIIGAPAADGIHCLGSCTLKNVWWEDVGEDAATFKGTKASQVMSIDCGGAKQAADKVFQQNGPGTMKISNFYAASFGKLYRSCGNCSKQYAKHLQLSGIRAEGGKSLAGMNENYGDTATFSNILAASGIVICTRYQGNSSGDEPTSTGSGPDGKTCIYKASDIHGL